MKRNRPGRDHGQRARRRWEVRFRQKVDRAQAVQGLDDQEKD